MGCLNLLNEPEVFISIAALLALVLLVWVQLHVHGKGPRSVNWICGVAWAYLAILFALTAVALFILKISAWDKGFLILSFLMTGINIITLLVLNVAELFIRDFSDKKPLKKPYEEPPVQSPVGKSAKKKRWVFVWLALLVGLILISFSLVDSRPCPCFWVGKALVILVFLKVLIVMICVNYKSLKNCCLCKCVRNLCAWHMKKCRKKKAKKVEKKEKKRRKCCLCAWIRNHWCNKKKRTGKEVQKKVKK